MKTVLITGANRGIGLEFVRQYLESGWKVIACCRSIEEDHAAALWNIAQYHTNKLQIEKIDLLEHESIDVMSNKYANVAIDLLINSAGIIGPIPIEEHLEAQHFGTLDYDIWETVIRTNTFGPIKMAEAFKDQLLLGVDRKIITLSSTVGSLQEDTTPAFCYCSSKTAVNKAIQMLSGVLSNDNIIVLALCPGHVKTRMGWSGADIEIDESVTAMRKLIEELTIVDSGSFRRFNGDTIKW